MAEQEPCHGGGCAALGQLLRSLTQLRSTATVAGRIREPLDSQRRLPKQRTINQNNMSHWVALLLAQRIPVPGNSYFWRTARMCYRYCEYPQALGFVLFAWSSIRPSVTIWNPRPPKLN